MNVVYVDENDKVIGAGSMAGAIDNGIRVRIARVFLTNSSGDLLIQKRSETISLPGKWDQSAAGHVDEDEDYVEAAARELQEEMGVRDVALQEVADYYAEEGDEIKTKKRFNKIFSGVYDGEVDIDKDEVSDYQWIELAKLESEMKNTPNKFTQGFIEAFEIYRQKTG